MVQIQASISPAVRMETYIPRHMTFGTRGITGCQITRYAAYCPEKVEIEHKEIQRDMDAYNAIIDQIWDVPEFPEFFTEHGLCVSLDDLERKFGKNCVNLIHSIKAPRYCCPDLFCRAGYFMCTDTQLMVSFELEDQVFEFNMRQGICEFFTKGKKVYSYSWTEQRRDLCYALADKFATDGVLKNIDDSFVTLLGYQCEDQTDGTSIQQAMTYLINLLKNRGYLKIYNLIPRNYKDLWTSYTEKKDGTVAIMVLDPKYKKDKLLCERIRCLLSAFALDEDGDLCQSHPLYDPATEDINLDIPFYFLQDKNDKMYISRIPGQFGGHKKLRIYGRLDCPSAARYIKKGQYVQYRVFFADEETAIAAGYRPCAKCMREAYKKWKESQA